MDANFDYDKFLEDATQEMYGAEDALIESGFSQEQWTLIKKYVLSAILHNQTTMLKILGTAKIAPTS